MAKHVALVIMNDSGSAVTPTIPGYITISGGGFQYGVPNNTASGESFIASVQSDSVPEIAVNSALLFLVDNGNQLKIENSGETDAEIQVGSNKLTIAGIKNEAKTSLTIGSTSTLFLGGYDAKLNHNGLGEGDIAYASTEGTLKAGGPGTLTLNSNLVLDGGSIIHIGRTSKNTDGQSTPTTYVDSLTVSGVKFTFKGETRLNIGSNGAAGDCKVECSGNSEEIVVSGCTINVGGGKGGMSNAKGKAGGAGGKGELKINANITNSRIYCGSGGGGAGGYYSSGVGGAGGAGGDGTVTISSEVTNSYIFAGGAGGGGAGAGGEIKGNDGNLTIGSGSSQITNKVIQLGLYLKSSTEKNTLNNSFDNCVIFCGSGGGGAGAGGSDGSGGSGGYGNYGGAGVNMTGDGTGGAGGSSGGGGAEVISGGGGGAGGSSGNGTAGAAGAGANVSLAFDLHGYIGQQLPFSFVGLSPDLPALVTGGTKLLDGKTSFITAKTAGLAESWTTASTESGGMTYDLSKYPTSQQVYPFNGYKYGSTTTYEIWNDYYTFNDKIMAINPSHALTSAITAKSSGTLSIDVDNDIIQQSDSTSTFEYVDSYSDVSKTYIYRSGASHPFIFDCKNFTLENGGKIKMTHANGVSFTLSNIGSMTKITKGTSATTGAIFTVNITNTKLNGCEVHENTAALGANTSINASGVFTKVIFDSSESSFNCGKGLTLEFKDLTSIGNMKIINSNDASYNLINSMVSIKNLTGTIPSVIDTSQAIDIDGLSIDSGFTTLTFANGGKASFIGKMTVDSKEKTLNLDISEVSEEQTIKIGSNEYLMLSDKIDAASTTLENSIDASVANKYTFTNQVANSKNLQVSNVNGTALVTNLSSIASGVTITSNGSSKISSSTINTNYNSVGLTSGITYEKNIEEKLDKVILTKDSSAFSQKQLTASAPSGDYQLTILFDGSVATIPSLTLSDNTTITIRNNTFETDKEITIPASSTFRIGDQEFTIGAGGSLTFSAGTVYTFIGENTNTINTATDALVLYYNNIELIKDGAFDIPAGTTLSNIVATIPGTPQKDLKIYGSATFEKAVKLNGSIIVDTNSSVTFNYGDTSEHTITGKLTVIGNSSLEFIDTTEFFDTTFINCVFAKPLKYSSQGKSQFINVKFGNAEGAKLTILEECLICASSNTETVLSYTKDVTFGKLFINPVAGLFVTNSSAMIFNGTLKVNRLTYLSGASPLSYSGSDSRNTIIFNSENYISKESPFTGTLSFEATASNCLLQINPAGKIALQSGSIFLVGGNSTNVTVNGTFESLVDNKTYTYQKSARLNGIMKVGVDFTSLGNIQLDSNGALYIGTEASRETGAETGAGDASTQADGETKPTISIESITVGAAATSVEIPINASNILDYQAVTDFRFRIYHNNTLTYKTYETTSDRLSGVTPSVTSGTSEESSYIDISYTSTEPSSFSNGEIGKLTLNVPPKSYGIYDISIENLVIMNAEGSDIGYSYSTINGTIIIEEPASAFFGSNSDVNIGGSLTILGNFYNNGKLVVNDDLTVRSNAHFQNDGTAMIKKATDNGLTLNGYLTLASGAKYIGNGSLVTEDSSKVTVQRNGECVINGSLTMGSNSQVLVKGGQAGLQVAFNGDISTGEKSYTFDSQQTSKEYIKINIDNDLETKSQPKP